MLKKIISYIFPVQLKKYRSRHSGILEINLSEGQKVLDTSDSNYSYGSLQRTLKKGLHAIEFSNAIEKILVLGMGAGSVVETIREEFKSDAFIDLVEIDPEIIHIANTEFSIGRFKNIRINQSDAYDFLQSVKRKYDLIIVDLFIINVIPEKFTSAGFISLLCAHLNAGGHIIYNTMTSTMKPFIFAEIKTGFEKMGLTITVLEKVEGANNLILARAVDPLLQHQ